jgi:excisionase family DNA binding protein
MNAQHAAAARPRAIPRLSLSKQEAADALGVSIDFFDEHIAHELRMVRRGRRRLIAVRELERWLDRHADGVGAE